MTEGKNLIKNIGSRIDEGKKLVENIGQKISEGSNLQNILGTQLSEGRNKFIDFNSIVATVQNFKNTLNA